MYTCSIPDVADPRCGCTDGSAIRFRNRPYPPAAGLKRLVHLKPPPAMIKPRRPRLFFHLLSSAAALLAAAALRAQTAPSRPADPVPEPVTRRPVVQRQDTPARLENDPVVLSPFMVSRSANDIGYYAENTLAGSRLNSNIGDLAASITIVTRQQMLDTASVDMNDVFLYEANTEGTGNYTAFAFDNRGSITDNTATNPSTSNRVRGIGSVDRAHNYYPSIPQLQFDVYNTETVEINRGPNSLLFGLGSASGIVNQSSSNATLDHNTAQVSGRVGSYGSYRGSLRFNQMLVPGKLALFGAALYDSQAFSRKPSSDISRRQYLAATYAPFSRTTVRANFENYGNYNRRPNSVLPRDQITPWRDAGSPSWDPITRTATVNGVSTVYSSANSVNGLRADPFAQFPVTYYDQGSVDPILWMQRDLSSTGPNGPTFTANQLLATSSSFYAKNTAKYPLFQTPSVTDQSIYDWTSVNMNAGLESKTAAKIYNVEVDQKLAENLFLQLGWYREDFDWFRYQGSGALLTIDPNTRLLDGSANPFFGRPFVEYLTGENIDQKVDNNNYRVSLAYQLDMTKRANWTRYLGKHQLMLFGTRRELDTTNYRYQQYVSDAHTWVNPTNIISQSLNLAGASPDRRFYLGGTDGNIAYAPGLATHRDFDFPFRYAMPGAGGTYNWVNDPAEVRLQLDANTSRNQQITNSLTYALQSSFVQDRVIVTAGIRRDENRARNTKALVVNPDTGLLDQANLENLGPLQDVFGTTRTAGIVVKPLPWFSLFYNDSENFTPAIQQLNLFGDPLALPTGKGKDYGIRFNFFKSKLVASLNWFKASAQNARGTAATTYIQQMARFDHNDFTSWANKISRARLGATATSTQIAAETAKITQLSGPDDPPAEANLSSTSTIDAKGLEFQLIYNPVPNWNIKLTAGQQRSVFSAIAPEFDAWEALRLPIWLAAKDDSGNRFWTRDRGTGQTEEAWYALNVTAGIKLAKALEGKRTAGQREWNASIISTYRFVSGPLKFFEIGGSTRWQDRAIIGYLGMPPDADGVIRTLDPDKSVYDDPTPSVDLWVSRNFTLPSWLNRKVRAKVQLNVRNVFENGGLAPIAVNPDGAINTYRIIDPRQWYLTTTFDF